MLPKAAWRKEEQLYFDNFGGYHPGGARVLNTKSGTVVWADSIDHVLSENGKRETFIKMDIEGSEFMALLGAERTIRDYKPRLAISLYHKPSDVLEIPFLIQKFYPGYRFGIRQYSSFMEETVLYAF